MFPGKGAVPEQFTIASTQVGYLLTHALRPYFIKELVEDIGHSFVSALYDETTNNEGKKKLAIALRYCSQRS